jgi:hypothetical protein
MSTRLVFAALFLVSGMVLMAAPLRAARADWVERQIADQGSAGVMAGGAAVDSTLAADWTDRMIAARAAGPALNDWVDRMVADRSLELAPPLLQQGEVKTALAGTGNSTD